MANNEQPVAPAADSEASISDRIAAKFLGEDPPEAPAEQQAAPQDDQPSDEQPTSEAQENADAPAEPAFEEIEYDGKRYEVPRELKDAILRQDDYTRKTQEVAQRAREIELRSKAIELAESQNKFAEAVRSEVSELAQIDAQLGQFKHIDWLNMSGEDAMKYRGLYDQLKAKRDEVDATLQSKHRQWQEQVSESQKALIQQGLETVRKAIPNFSEATVKNIREYGMSRGLSEQELSSVFDPRFVRILHDAAEYAKLQSQKSKGTPVPNKVAPVGQVKPVNPMPNAVKEKLAYSKAIKQAKTSREKADLIARRLESSFR